jgi:hypothetical protein
VASRLERRGANDSVDVVEVEEILGATEHGGVTTLGSARCSLRFLFVSASVAGRVLSEDGELKLLSSFF